MTVRSVQPAPSAGWTVVIALKRLAMAKTRISWSDPDRQRLALAMARDTVAAVSACRSVARILLVCSDVAVTEQLRGPSIYALHDEPGRGLNAAFGYGFAVARIRHPGQGVALMTADLPAATAGEVEFALAAVTQHHIGVVPDHAGTGTTMLAATAGHDIGPAFGIDSLARHAAAGAAVIDAPELRGLRLDIDVPADLAAAAELRLGPFTSALLAEAGQGAPDTRGFPHADRPSERRRPGGDHRRPAADLLGGRASGW